MTLPRGIRNRNPGNIERSGKFTWQGELRLPQTDKRYDQRFCVFDEAENGLRALMKLLINYQQKHKVRTVRQAINRWAPSVENNTSAYINAVAKSMDASPDEELDFADYAVLVPLARAIVVHENGHPANEIGPDYKSFGYDDYWYTPAVYQTAYELAVKGRVVTHTMNRVPQPKPEIFKPKPRKTLTWWQRILKTIKGE